VFARAQIVAGGDQACDPHERGFGLLYADSLIILDVFPARREDRIFWRHDPHRFARTRERPRNENFWETVESWASTGLKRAKLAWME